MKKSDIYKKLREKIIKKIEEKNSWGKNELKEKVIEIFFEVMEEDAKDE